ncbi:hypothetical protein D3C83_51980 [compost metagenome]
MRLDLAGRSDARRAFDDDSGMDDRVGADLHVRIDVGRGGVDQRDASRHQFLVLLLSQHRAHFRQLRSAVDSADFLRIVDE